MADVTRKLTRRRLVGAYISSVISIGLVLLLVGIAALLVVNARTVSDYFKETMQMSVLMKPDVDDDAADLYRRHVDSLGFVNTATLITRAQGEKELKAMLGEDFLSVFETSPVPVSVDVTLKAEYVSKDSLAMVTASLADSPLVDEVSCQQSLVEALNANLSRIALVLGVFILIMLFISFVLIGNTVRINIFNRRFTIHTMQLVGATRSFIRRPFMWGAVWQGLASSVLALLALAGALYAIWRSFPQLFAVFDVRSLCITAAVVVASGVMICMISTFFTVNKLVSAGKDELYF